MAEVTSGRIVSVDLKRHKFDPPLGININVATDTIDAKGEEITVGYTFTANYADSVAELKIKGIITLKEDAKKAKDIVKSWKDSEEKKLPDDFAEVLMNAITYTCAVNGTFFTQPMGLNAPMVLRTVRIAQPPAGDDSKSEKKKPK